MVKRKGGDKKKSGKGAESIPLPAIKMDPQRIEDALYFDPTFLQVEPGDQFLTSLYYYNSQSHQVKEADLWVHYDPRALEPVWVDAEPLKKLCVQPLDVRVWREAGYIRLKCQLNAPLKGSVCQLADFHWRALIPMPDSPIELTAPKGETVALLAGGQNVIQTNGLGNSLRVSTVIQIKARPSKDFGLRMASEVGDALRPPPTSDMERLRLAIDPKESTVSSGEVATADVRLINPTHQAFDELKFRIRFDPTAVKILDADDDNYINGGTNIFDGDFHKQYPFGIHIANNVDQEAGLIDYHVASNTGPMVYPSGTVARIAYRMTREAGTAVFWFEPVDPFTETRMTDVSFQGRSLLGESVGLAREALHGAEIAVRPMDLSQPGGETAVAPPAVKLPAKL